jgi:anti-sigma factor RsiW
MTDHDLDDVLQALLGPSAPEVSCDECFDALDAYVDREVLRGDAERAMPGLAAHLRGCPACAEDHASLRALVLAQRGVSGP